MRRQTRRLSSGPDRHVPAEGEEDAELSGALRPSAGVLSGVGHGEESLRAGTFGLGTRAVFSAGMS